LETDRYAEEWKGLFPRFVLAAFLLAILEFSIDYVPAHLIAGTSLPSQASLALYDNVEDISNVILVPFGLFALFYLAARIRINLGKDYAAVALSIFLGALVAYLPLDLVASFAGGSNIPAIDTVFQYVGSSAATSLYYTFIGFSAILMSYYRRM
jgi:hypothetical protein